MIAHLLIVAFNSNFAKRKGGCIKQDATKSRLFDEGLAYNFQTCNIVQFLAFGYRYIVE